MSGIHGVDPSVVFVVFGRNLGIQRAVFGFLRAIGLRPMEWTTAVKLTGKGSPYIGEILDSAFKRAQAVVVVLTPDEIAQLRHEYATEDDIAETTPAPQARPNVLFEAGMALGRNPDRTILVEVGRVRPFSDIAGRHILRLDNSPARRKELADRLATAGCAVDLTGNHWLSAGNLDPPAPPTELTVLPTGRRLAHAPAPRRVVRLDAHHHNRGRGEGRLEVINRGTVAILVHDIETPLEAGPSFQLHAGELPSTPLPPGKSLFFLTSRCMGAGEEHFNLTIRGETPDGETVTETAFISLAG